MKVLVPLAEGFEEIEAVTIVDVLRRTDIDVITVYLDNNPVIGAHDIPVTADKGIHEINSDDIDSIILPGGMPGSENLKNSKTIIDIVKKIYSKEKLVAAICAAPIVLGHAGILHGKKATCYPGFEKEIKGAYCVDKPVVTDGNIITGSAAGSALPFALEIVKNLKGEDFMTSLKEMMQVNWI